MKEPVSPDSDSQPLGLSSISSLLSEACGSTAVRLVRPDLRASFGKHTNYYFFLLTS